MDLSVKRNYKFSKVQSDGEKAKNIVKYFVKYCLKQQEVV